MRDEHGTRPGDRHGGYEEFGRGEFGRGGGRGGRRRMFDAGELRLVLLRLIEAQPRHGYDLIREIETRTGGAYAPSPGIVYPTLTMLEELEQIEAAASDGSKRAFALTAAGKAYLADHLAEAETALRRLDALRAEGEQVDSGPILRAMHNLKIVLRQRLTGASDKQTVFDAADLIDEAARKIERLP
jgi:DNA-binding PadR family transcriptional regulator